MPVSREAATWALRLIVGQEPTGTDIVDFHRNAYDSVEALRDSFLRTPQARAFFDKAKREADEKLGPTEYRLPAFLLRRPPYPDVAWRFEEPSLEKPVCQLCTSEQMAGQRYADLCAELGVNAQLPHRKLWEFAFILAALKCKGVLEPGRRGLGFGTGTEPLPCVFARYDVEVTATDAPAGLELGEAWAKTDQWAKGLEDLFDPKLVDRETFDRNVSFRAADMNAIPADLRGYDFCWSACCFEHLGSIRKGLDFLHASLETLKPGGISVQTTEFNLASDSRTIESSGLVLFRKSDIETVIHELVDAGHHVEPLNTWPGATPVDEHIDVPPYSSPHLKLELLGYPTTSIGLVITKRGGERDAASSEPSARDSSEDDT
jgi:hypothetical protein